MMVEAAAKTGRDVGNYVLMMVIADETDEKAMAKWKLYNDGADMGAMAWMSGQADADPNAVEGGTAKAISAPEGAINFNMGTLVGSYATVAKMLDECATVPGTKGIMLTFDDFPGRHGPVRPAHPAADEEPERSLDQSRRLKTVFRQDCYHGRHDDHGKPRPLEKPRFDVGARQRTAEF